MRVLHVTDCYLPRLGGIELHVHDLTVRQRLLGHDAEIVTVTSAAADADGDPPWVHRLGQSLRGERTSERRAESQLATLLRAGNVDLVHVHVSVLSPFATVAAHMAAARGLPTLVTVHSMWSRLGPLPALARMTMGLRRWPVTWSAVSSAAAEPIRAMLGPTIPVHVVPNAVDPAHWAVDAATSPPADEVVTPPPTLVSVMRLTRTKRPLPLMRMVREVRARVPASQPLRAVIIGDGPQRGAVERYLRRHRMDGWVHLAGRLDRSAIRDHLTTAALYVAPAELESFGIAALEARTAGLPVVGSSRSGLREFVSPGVEGLLADDDAGMVEAMVRLLTDDPLRAAISRQNRTVPPAHDWDTICAGTLDLYRHVVASRTAARPLGDLADSTMAGGDGR